MKLRWCMEWGFWVVEIEGLGGWGRDNKLVISLVFHTSIGGNIFQNILIKYILVIHTKHTRNRKEVVYLCLS